MSIKLVPPLGTAFVIMANWFDPARAIFPHFRWNPLATYVVPEDKVTLVFEENVDQWVLCIDEPITDNAALFLITHGGLYPTVEEYKNGHARRKH